MTVFGANNLISARHCGRYGKSGRWLGWLRGSGCPVYRVPQLSGSTVVHFPNSSGETFTQLHFYFHVCTALSRSRVCTPRCRPTPLSFTWCVLATVTLLGTLSVNLASVTPWINFLYTHCCCHTPSSTFCVYVVTDNIECLVRRSLLLSEPKYLICSFGSRPLLLSCFWCQACVGVDMSETAHTGFCFFLQLWSVAPNYILWTCSTILWSEAFWNFPSDVS